MNPTKSCVHANKTLKNLNSSGPVFSVVRRGHHSSCAHWSRMSMKNVWYLFIPLGVGGHNPPSKYSLLCRSVPPPAGSLLGSINIHEREASIIRKNWDQPASYGQTDEPFSQIWQMKAKWDWKQCVFPIKLTRGRAFHYRRVYFV